MTHENAHISRGENTNTRPTSPARTRGANGRRGGARVALLCVFLCPAAHFCRRNGGVARQVNYRPAHARASSRERHSSPAIGRATGSFANSKKQKASHIIRSNSRCLASAQHILSHACLPACLHRVILICAYHRLPLLAYSFNPRYRYNETCPSKSHPRDEACCRADPPRSPGSER
jgi:hypothetical protein